MSVRLQIALGCAFVLAAGTAGAAELGFVWVESNVGGASGGHFALRLDDRVYSYHASDDGLLLLERRTRRRFEFHYATLENRPLHVASVEVPADVFARVRDGFSGAYLDEQRALARVERCRENVALLETLVGERTGVRARGAGLLDPRRAGSDAGRALRRAIEARLGRDFLAREIARLGDALRGADLGADRGDAALTRHRERLAERAALVALRDARDVDVRAVVPADAALLSAEEAASLAGLRERLTATVIGLLTSKRPDRGHALFLAAARHHAVQRSLDESRLVLLDPLVRNAAVLDAREVESRRAELEAVASYSERVYRAERTRLRGAGPSERGYQRIEEWAARAAEHRAALDAGRGLHTAVERRPPERRRTVAAIAPATPEAELRASLAAARRRLHALRRDLRAERGYGLLERNCATGVIETLNASLGGARSAEHALGGRLEAGDGLGFVPFVLFGQVRERLAVTRVERVASYRERRLRAQRDSSWLGSLREATTLTSSIYRPRADDTSFLLFTDDVFWARPAFGLVNLGWGLADGLAGVVTAPLDRGRRFRRGLSGAFFSLPELAWVNVRKGSFDASTLAPEDFDR
ncbi:MAG: hypothetical protein JRG82_17975 [Deltaproteobacteria bacterium]|nr:hypothetical protein [Deltaproteobacteria bacterium]